jgi:aryl-alcohol dehydrogenase-like predicted oxidoreductase
METIKITPLKKTVSRICLGTWAIGGWMWGGTEEQESINTIHKAFDLSVGPEFMAPPI